ncbi:MAG: hypothetical protein R3248_07205 [Candidatus Promineifilaceae bacterium]|nr:hypothetical protein [Candidatus Promineifilaceae bacterium]
MSLTVVSQLRHLCGRLFYQAFHVHLLFYYRARQEQDTPVTYPVWGMTAVAACLTM